MKLKNIKLARERAAKAYVVMPFAAYRTTPSRYNSAFSAEQQPPRQRVAE